MSVLISSIIPSPILRCLVALSLVLVFHVSESQAADTEILILKCAAGLGCDVSHITQEDALSLSGKASATEARRAYEKALSELGLGVVQDDTMEAVKGGDVDRQLLKCASGLGCGNASITAHDALILSGFGSAEEAKQAYETGNFEQKPLQQPQTSQQDEADQQEQLLKCAAGVSCAGGKSTQNEAVILLGFGSVEEAKQAYLAANPSASPSVVIIDDKANVDLGDPFAKLELEGYSQKPCDGEVHDKPSMLKGWAIPHCMRLGASGGKNCGKPAADWVCTNIVRRTGGSRCFGLFRANRASSLAGVCHNCTALRYVVCN